MWKIGKGVKICHQRDLNSGHIAQQVSTQPNRRRNQSAKLPVNRYVNVTLKLNPVK